jgi:hypothetical protein
MRSRAEIERHIQVLAHAAVAPCDCASTGHDSECEQGRLMMFTTASALRWALGIPSNYGKIVAEMDGVLEQERDAK